jgi:methylphosphotriester-DNA--protein-cysteine methyltransferase
VTADPSSAAIAVGFRPCARSKKAERAARARTMTSMLDGQRVKTLWRKAASLLPPKQAKSSQQALELMAA